jgi:hypothetical protein
MFKKLTYASMLAAAIGLPYAISNVSSISELAQGIISDAENGSSTAATALSPPTTATSYAPATDPANPYASAQEPYANPYPTLTLQPGQPLPTGGQQGALPPLAGPTVDQLGEVLRFDVSPAWVAARWARVTATLADTQLDGLRVPLVSGVSDSDLTGSLTYYFDKEQQVQRLTFHGTTGNSQRLVQLLTESYKFQREPTLGGEVYTRRWNGRPTSVCRIRTAPVLRADMPNSKLEVLLEINRPGMAYGLSDAAKTLVEQEQRARLW